MKFEELMIMKNNNSYIPISESDLELLLHEIHDKSLVEDSGLTNKRYDNKIEW